MNIDSASLLRGLLWILGIVVSVGVTFYLKDALQSRTEYKKFREKLAGIGGNRVVYGSGPDRDNYRILSIDRHGITLQNDIQTIFLPSRKVVESEFIVPGEKYEERRLAKIASDTKNVMRELMPVMLDEMKNLFLQEVTDEGSEISAVMAVKFTKFLKDEGIQLKKLPGAASA